MNAQDMRDKALAYKTNRLAEAVAEINKQAERGGMSAVVVTEDWNPRDVAQVRNELESKGFDVLWQPPSGGYAVMGIDIGYASSRLVINWSKE